MRIHRWALSGLALGIGMVAFAAANDGQSTWEGHDTRARPQVSLLKLLKQYDGPVDLKVMGAPVKCIGTQGTDGIILNENEALYQHLGQIYHNTLERRCAGLRSVDGSTIRIPGPSQQIYPAGNSTICSGHSASINDGFGTGPGVCVLGDFVPVTVIGAADASAATTR